MAKNKSFFEKKSVVLTFGVLSLLGGLFFVYDTGLGSPTGNAILTEGSFSIITFIGLMLLICSIVLIAYAVVKK
ncbi:MAG TPA: hypothetical protein VJH92_06525 [Candidatus Nanoarchaeia archaeon]|nr:hypothetical protein [Candidatus Nanoarchaeia archaeon]